MDRRERLYQQVADALRHALEEGRYADRLPTENALVEQFHVSLTTVKKALQVLVDEGRIVRISGKGTFPVRPGSPPTVTAAPRSGRVGFLIPSLPDGFARRLLKGAAERLARNQVYLLLGLTAPDMNSESAVIRRFRDQGVDGMIICPVPGEHYNEEILRMKLDRFPFVLVDKWLTGIDTPYVVSDSRRLVKQAVEHLAGLGHRRVALLTVSTDHPELTQSLAERIRGFEEGIAETGLVMGDNPLWMVPDGMTPDASRMLPVIERWLSETEVTAVIACTTEDTLLVLQAATFIAEGGLPATLTWIDQSEEEMGRQAAEIMLQVIADPVQTPKSVVPGLLHIGASTATPPALTVTDRPQIP
jgi:DNA-binding LacI/PurR family transcriptional regulator